MRDTGDPQRAVAIYQKGVQAGPPADDIHRKRLVEVYLRTNQTQQATELLETMLRADPGDKNALAARSALRAASGQPAEIDRAIAEFTALVEANPQVVSYRYDLARALRLRGRTDEARAQLLKALATDPNHLPSLEEIAGLSILQARAQDAFNYAGRALSVNPKLPRTRLVFSAALALQGKSAEARQEINSLIREFPALREAHLQLALLNMQDKRFREAEAIYRQHYWPGQSDPRILRGLVELGLVSGQPERMLQSLQEEVKLQPASAETRLLLATTAERMNNSVLAREQFQWLKQNSPPSAEVEMAIGLSYQQNGDWVPAIKQFQLARSLAPKNPDALSALAYALQQSGQPAEAIPVYREALQLLPDALIVKSNLAMALADSGGDLNRSAAVDPIRGRPQLGKSRLCRCLRLGLSQTQRERKRDPDIPRGRGEGSANGFLSDSFG